MKRVLLIINPISGTLSKDGLTERVRSALESTGAKVDSVLTEHAGHAAELASNAHAEGYDVVLAAGGDGTVNEVASALCGGNVALGILPYGSGNGLARHIYGSIDVDHALRIIARSNVEWCDYGSANDRCFFCTFGLGFDARVTQLYSTMPERGIISYARSVIREYVNFTPVHCEILTGDISFEVNALAVVVCNASQYGNNAFIAPQASIRDGLLDLIVVHSGNPFTRALAGVELFTGRMDSNYLVEAIRVPEATIIHEPGAAHVDGEPLEMPRQIEIRCHHAQLPILVDPEKPPFRPFLSPITSMRQDSSFLIRENARHILDMINNFLKKPK